MNDQCDRCGPKAIPDASRIRLRHLKNVIYRNIDKDLISHYEILHFKLYYLCSSCGFTTVFERDEAPYYVIRFMLRYPCYHCFNRNGIDDFMIEVSPDKGAVWEPDQPGCILEDEFENSFNTLVTIQYYEKQFPNCIGHA
jgi:hypothetical protein